LTVAGLLPFSEINQPSTLCSGNELAAGRGSVHQRHQRATGLIDWSCSIAATNVWRDVFCGRSCHDLLGRDWRDRPEADQRLQGQRGSAGEPWTAPKQNGLVEGARSLKQHMVFLLPDRFTSSGDCGLYGASLGGDSMNILCSALMLFLATPAAAGWSMSALTEPMALPPPEAVSQITGGR
jgi:hypothetical protein